MASKRYAKVSKFKCVACGACESVCPLGVIKVYKGCYANVEAEKCAGCRKCENICPASSINSESRANG